MDVILQYATNDLEWDTIYDGALKDRTYVDRDDSFLGDMKDIASQICESEGCTLSPYGFSERTGPGLFLLKPMRDTEGVRVHYRGGEEGLDAFLGEVSARGYGTPERIYTDSIWQTFDKGHARQIADKYAPEVREKKVGSHKYRPHFDPKTRHVKEIEVSFRDSD